MDGQLVNQVIANTKALKAMQNQRRSSIVRKYGEEHDSKFVGNTATFYLPVDTDMEYISELQIKLVLGSIGEGANIAGGTSIPVDFATNKYPTFSSWVAAFPVGAFVDIDKHFGPQCVDYAWAFWKAQVSRNIITNNNPNKTGSAADIWNISRVANAGTAFDLITNKTQIKKGDWVVTGAHGNYIYGHISLAAEDYNSSHPNTLLTYGQCQGGAPLNGGSVISLNNVGIGYFLGAFRYKHWTVD